MALKVLNGSQSRKAKLAAVAGVAAMLVSLNATSDAYASKLNLGPAVAEQSTKVIRDAVACCDEIANFVNLDASQTALKEQITNLFALIDDEHKRLEAFADQLGARLVRADGEPDPEGDPGSDVGGGGGKENSLWLSMAGFQADGEPDQEGGGPGTDVGGGGGKENLAWLSKVAFQADEEPTPESGPGTDVGGGGGKENLAWLSRL